MKKKSKKGYKLSEETLEKLKIEAEIKAKQEEEEKNKLSEKELKKQAKKEKKRLKKEEKKRRNQENKISIPKAVETIFCMVYLGFLAICIWEFFSLANKKAFLLFACLTTILSFGDAFHLLPRIFDNMKKNGIKNKEFWYGLGSQISSITMTWFYLLLYFTYKAIFPDDLPAIGFDIAIYVTVGLRILICLLPQNRWYSDDKNIALSIIRNLIFLVTAILEIIIFAKIGDKGGYGLWKMSIAIGLSFAFYLPVAFSSKKHKKIGILMIPKTLCYVWMLCMGLDLIGKV